MNSSTNRTPKIINSNNPIKTKPKVWTQPSTEITGINRKITKNYLNTSTYSSSESTSCCSSLLSSCSPTTPTNFRQATNQNTIKNQKLKQIQNQIQHSQIQNHQHQNQNQQNQNQNHLVYENLIHQSPILLPPQITRSPSAPTHHHHPNLLPQPRAHHINHSSHPVEDQFDSARINRKILDLEISNASLLAINGALERTKVNQQNEIRTIKKKLQQYTPAANNNGNSQGSQSSYRGTKTSPKSPQKTLRGSRQGSEGHEEEEEEEEEDSISLDKLIDQDLEFGHVIQSIDHLISTATKAINFQPSLNLSSLNSNTNTTTTITTKEIDQKNMHDRPQQLPIPVGKSKVLNPIQAQRFLSNLDSNNRLVDLHDQNLILDNDADVSLDPFS